MEYYCREIIKRRKTAWKADRLQEQSSKPLKINEIDSTQESGWTLMELNRVLGGGVPGSSLLGGEQGVENLLLQISLKLPYKTLYVSGEESQKQIKMRAERITSSSDNCCILTETKPKTYSNKLKQLSPKLSS
jgi:DNA repair protein RadA/Sms